MAVGRTQVANLIACLSSPKVGRTGVRGRKLGKPSQAIVHRAEAQAMTSRHDIEAV